jgi:hypothetical protein
MSWNYDKTFSLSHHVVALWDELINLFDNVKVAQVKFWVLLSEWQNSTGNLKGKYYGYENWME